MLQTYTKNVSPAVSNYSNKLLLLVRDDRTNSITIYRSNLEFVQADLDTYFLSFKWVTTPCKLDAQFREWIKF